MPFPSRRERVHRVIHAAGCLARDRLLAAVVHVLHAAALLHAPESLFLIAAVPHRRVAGPAHSPPVGCDFLVTFGMTFRQPPFAPCLYPPLPRA